MKNGYIYTLKGMLISIVVVLFLTACGADSSVEIPEEDTVDPEGTISVTFKNYDGVEVTETFTNAHATMVLEDAPRVHVPKGNDYTIVFSGNDNTAISAIHVERTKLVSSGVPPEHLPVIDKTWDENNARAFRNKILTHVRHSNAEVWYTLTVADYHGNTDFVGYVVVNNAL